MAKTLNLSEGEKQFLLTAQVGEGLLFAGQNYITAQFLASKFEYDLITSKPQDIENQQKEAAAQQERETAAEEAGQIPESHETYTASGVVPGFTPSQPTPPIQPLQPSASPIQNTEVPIPQGTAFPQGTQFPQATPSSSGVFSQPSPQTPLGALPSQPQSSQPPVTQK